METETALIFARQHPRGNRKVTATQYFYFIAITLCLTLTSFALSGQTNDPPQLSATNNEQATRGTIHIKKEIKPLAPAEFTPDPIDRFWQYGIRYGWNCGGLGRKPFLITNKRLFYWSGHLPFIDVYLKA